MYLIRPSRPHKQQGEIGIKLVKINKIEKDNLFLNNLI